LAEALYQDGNVGMDPNRPYNGQPWTDEGERGKQEVFGITMRDLCDCMVVGFLMSTENLQGLAESGTATYNDLYNDEDIDPRAVIQNTTCEVEKRMGIFTNYDEANLQALASLFEQEDGK
jgi:hypothetical protein